MKIILEGCDGTGKTTLAKILAERYGLDICHCTASDPKDFNFYKQTARKENVIWDRHTIGELIYPKVFNREMQLSPEDARICLAYARENNGKVFVLTSDIAVIRKRLSARSIGESQKILDNIEFIDSQFRFYAEAFCVPIIDTSKIYLDDIFKMIEKEDYFRFMH